jgi:DNA-binding NarL/FixJ family response regulator
VKPIDGPMVQAVVAAGHEILHRVLERACREAPVAIVAIEGTAREAAAACRAHRPDLLIVDVDLPDADGLQLLRELGSDRPVSVLVLADRADDELVLRALRLGASGVVRKADGLHHLGETIRVVADGHRAIAPDLHAGALRALGRLARRAREAAEIADRLSGRQLEVLQLLSEGMTVGQTATRLGLSPRTVESHVAKVYARLGVRTRLEAVSRAAGLGLVEL